MRSHYCGLLDESFLDKPVTLCGWVNRRPRSRWRDFYRPARPRRAGAGGVQPAAPGSLRDRRERAQRIRAARNRPGAPPPGRHRESAYAHRSDRSGRRPDRDSEPGPGAAVPARRHRAFRAGASQVPLSRSAPRRDAAQPAAASSHRADAAALSRRAALHRDRNADAHQIHARGRARLPRAVAHAPRPLLRAAAVAAAVQATADDGRFRALLSVRALLPR